MAIFHGEMFSNTLRRLVPFTACIPTEIVDVPGTPALDKSKPLRTIYLLHGFSGRCTDWLYGSRIERLARAFNVAVIMPEGENSFYTDDAAREALYSTFICVELVDFARRTFPLSDKREDTVIGGLSMGGYGAIRNGLLHSDVFGSIFAFSSALITEGVSKMKPGDCNTVAKYEYYHSVFGELEKLIGSDKDPAWLAKQARDADTVPSIFMACGTEDFLLEENRAFHKTLNELNIPHEYHESPGVHDWKFWDEYIEKALMWYGKVR